MTHVTFTLSPPVRYAALLGLLATVLVGGGMKMVGGGQSSTQAPPIIEHHLFGPGAKTKQRSTTPAVAPKAAAHVAAQSKPKAARTPARAKPAAAPTPAVNQPAIAAALKAGLPASIATALGQHGTVIVALYNPYSQVDAIAFAEARAGAALAGAGFVPLDVLSKAQVGNLTNSLGLLPDPGVLVYVRPASLAAKISGFADKETVAQAAQNAARGT